MELLRVKADLGISAPRPKMSWCKVCALATVIKFVQLYMAVSLIFAADQSACANATDDSESLWKIDITNNLCGLKVSTVSWSAKASVEAILYEGGHFHSFRLPKKGKRGKKPEEQLRNQKRNTSRL